MHILGFNPYQTAHVSGVPADWTLLRRECEHGVCTRDSGIGLQSLWSSDVRSYPTGATLLLLIFKF